ETSLRIHGTAGGQGNSSGRRATQGMEAAEGGTLDAQGCDDARVRLFVRATIRAADRDFERLARRGEDQPRDDRRAVVGRPQLQLQVFVVAVGRSLSASAARTDRSPEELDRVVPGGARRELCR